jgi:hypothetical protein
MLSRLSFPKQVLSDDLFSGFQAEPDQFTWVPSPSTEGMAGHGNPPASDDPFYTVEGTTIQGSYIPATSSGSTTDTSTPGSLVAVTSGGITVSLLFDAAAMAAPASFRSGIQQAVAILAANITDKITVNIKIDCSGTGGGAAAGPDSGYYENYSWVRSVLTGDASPGDTSFNSLPSGSSIQGQSNVAVWNAQLKIWGVLGANDTTTDDGSATFATDINPNLLVGVALHELTHAFGRVPYGSAPDVFDLFRFTSPGVQLFQGGSTAPAAYFSLDGGYTKLADYGRTSDPSDFLNTGVQGANDPFNEYYASNTIQGLTAVDLKQLDALGFHLTINSPIVIESAGVTNLVQVGSYYFLDPTAGGSGPSLKYSGTPVVAGQFSPFTPIAAEQAASGYDIAWKASNADQYSIWSVDPNGNYIGNLLGTVAGSNPTLESFETIFHQDLNGDGVIGYPSSLQAQVQAQAHPNDLNYAGAASGYNHFIDFLNFEASFPDLISAFGLNQAAMQNWFNQRESIEKRVATFDGLDYVASYPDLIGAFAKAGSMGAVEDAGASHYIQYGANEHRTATFNGLDYIASYKDLIAEFGSNSDAGAFHFIEYGANEHRTTTFDGLNYIASYPDLIQAFGANEQAGAWHFTNYGSHEQRTTTFDGLSYIAQYGDLMKAFGADNDAGATHYIQYGYNEHRTTAFNVAAYEQAHPDLVGQFASADQFLTAYINSFVTTGHYLT